MKELTDRIIGRKVTGISHNYIDRSLTIILDNNTSIVFKKCAIIFDLGIIGNLISFVSHLGTLGMTLELKKLKRDPDDYKFILLSSDINAIENKKELQISYQEIELNSN